MALNYGTQFQHLIMALNMALNYGSELWHSIPALNYGIQWRPLITALYYCTQLRHSYKALNYSTMKMLQGDIAKTVDSKQLPLFPVMWWLISKHQAMQQAKALTEC